jgi:hypothetical protein
MWWHGSAEGWGCPIRGGDPDCRSTLHRPKSDPSEPWPYAARYPELRDDHGTVSEANR